MGEDTWLWALSAPQPGIRDVEEEKREGGLVADLGNTRVLYSKDRHSAKPRAAELQPPESNQGGNWADPKGLAFENVDAQLGKGNFSQTAEVSLRSDRDRSLARRERETVQHALPLLPVERSALPFCKPLKVLGYGECRWGAGIIITHSTGEETNAQTGDRLA